MVYIEIIVESWRVIYGRRFPHTLPTSFTEPPRLLPTSTFYLVICRLGSSTIMTGNATPDESSHLTPEGVGPDYGKDVRNAFMAGDQQASR